MPHFLLVAGQVVSIAHIAVKGEVAVYLLKNITKEIFLLYLLLLVFPVFAHGSENHRSGLGLQEAISIALKNNPSMEAARRLVRAKRAGLLQAGILPNPDLTIEMENFGGAGNLRGFRGTETTVQINQLIEMGGKRSHRRQVALREWEAARLEYYIAALNLSTQVEQAFWSVLAARERHRLTERLLRLAQDTLATARKRVEAGKVSPMELNKARVMYSSARIGWKMSFHRLETARKRFSNLLGHRLSKDYRLTGELKDLPRPKPYSILESYLLEGPRMNRARIAIEIQKARARLVRSMAVPDVTVSAGLRRFEETNSQAFVASFEIPLPIFDRRQGSRLSAEQEVRRAVSESQLKELELKNMLYAAYHTLESALEEVKGLEESALPEAGKSFNAAQEGYKHGKFSYLDLLDAQRTLFELRLRYIDALLACHTSWARISGITGSQATIVNDLGKDGKK